MGLFYNAPEPTRGVCSQKTVFLSVSVGSGPKPLIPYKMKFHMTHAGQINVAPHRRLVHYSASDSGAEYCDERVCVCLSVRDHIFGTTRPIFTNFFVHVTYGRGSVLLWRRNDKLCTSGFWMTSYLLISQGCSMSPPS